MSIEYRVTMKGTWTRDRTHSSDLTMVRQLSYRVNRGEGGLRGVESLRFIAAQPPEGADKRSLQERHGTFEVKVLVEADTYLNQTQVQARAKTILKWAMQDAFCRGPKLTITDISRFRRSWA
jgi:hypothetical protein